MGRTVECNIILKGCPRCHGDLHFLSMPAEGRRIRDWCCLQCSRSWPERKVLDMLQAEHVNCFPDDLERNKQHPVALLVMAKKLIKPRGTDGSTSSDEG